MNTEKFKGIFPALLTPFDANGKVNEKELERLINYNLEKGVDGFYVNGSTAESFLMEDADRELVYRLCAKYAKGKCTLIAQVGDMSVAKAIKYAKLCDELGYDAISSVTPFYFKYSSEQIIEYYLSLVDACNLPMFIYFIPALAGAVLDNNVFDTLLKDERVVGVKYTSNDFFTLERLRSKYPDKIFYNGYDEMCLSGLAMGADGAIGSTYNLMAEKFVEIYRLVKEGKWTEALAVQHRANDVISALVGGVDVKASLKFAISELVGIDMGLCLPPQTDVPETWKKNFTAEFGNEFKRA